MFTQSSNSDSVPHNLNLNASFAGQSGNNSQAMEFPNSFKFGASQNDQLRLVSCADPFQLPSGSAGFLVGESDEDQIHWRAARYLLKERPLKEMLESHLLVEL